MNKIFNVLLASLCITIAVNAQTKEDPTWVSIYLGHHEYKGDITNEMLKFDIPKDMAFGIGIQRYINSTFDFNYNLTIGELDTDYNFDGTPGFKKFFFNNNFQVKYKFANGNLLKEESAVKPFLTLGAGLTPFVGGDDFIDNSVTVNIPLGIGLDIPINEDLSFVYQSTYNLTFNDFIDGRNAKYGTRFVDDRGHDDFLIHTVGIKVNLFKKKDADGDGVKDSKDLCINEVGPESTMGCPDMDMDLIADKDDQCPEIAGLAAFNGCADTDSDGIADYDDACPNIVGTSEFMGCKDTDSDGIADPDDSCPNIAGLKSTNGCPDKDLDGIIDSKDNCPAVAGSAENGGCPDTDGDGVLDKDDECPTKVGADGNKGCPGVSVEVQEQLDVIFSNLLFGSNSTMIDPSSIDDIEKLAEIMANDKSLKLSIEGHTDSSGRAEYNLTLSQGRADTVKDFLVNKGISESRITSIGYGETRPIVSNETAEGRNKNRRVVLDLSYD